MTKNTFLKTVTSAGLTLDESSFVSTYTPRKIDWGRVYQSSTEMQVHTLEGVSVYFERSGQSETISVYAKTHNVLYLADRLLQKFIELGCRGNHVNVAHSEAHYKLQSLVNVNKFYEDDAEKIIAFITELGYKG